MVRIYVGVTDRDWYEFLRSYPELDEVNFWQPSGSRRPSTLSPGDLFLFKLHYPANAIVGGGTFVRFDSYPSWLVWEAFGQKNGAESYDDMRRRIERYRRAPLSLSGAEMIGCTILRDPFFLDESNWLSAPPDWAPNIVQGKTYRDSTAEGSALVGAILTRRSALTLAESPRDPDPAAPMFGEPALRRRRLGQGTFRLLVLDAYGRQCAVTGEKTLPVLESAHIRPVTQGGEHRIDNGLLLRSDIHTLFDRGYVTITPQGQFRTSRQLRTDYDNGEAYYAMERAPVALPDQPARPSAEFLEWHNDTVFLDTSRR